MTHANKQTKKQETRLEYRVVLGDPRVVIGVRHGARRGGGLVDGRALGDPFGLHRARDVVVRPEEGARREPRRLAARERAREHADVDRARRGRVGDLEQLRPLDVARDARARGTAELRRDDDRGGGGGGAQRSSERAARGVRVSAQRGVRVSARREAYAINANSVWSATPPHPPH